MTLTPRAGPRPARAAIAAVLLGLSACETIEPEPYTIDLGVLEAELDETIAMFECGYSTFSWVAMGNDDVLEPHAGVAASAHRYEATPPTGACDASDTSRSWFPQVMEARARLSNVAGNGLYDLLQTQPGGPEIERLSAIAAIYMAATLAHFGEFFCETTLDRGDLLTPEHVLGMAEEWITDRALPHVDAHGDFAVGNGITSSARTMALALRARIRWASGDLAGAAADAESVPEGFTAWVTRDAGENRRNRIYVSEVFNQYSTMYGVNGWWSGAPNPATGVAWPDSIPFTGYVFLGIAPDGRAVLDDGRPVRWAREERDLLGDPVPVGGGVVPDPRVPHDYWRQTGRPESGEHPLKFTSVSDDIPFVGWREMWLLRAEAAGGQAAIDRVNELRAAAVLPPVSYLTGSSATAEEIRSMIIEERRRELLGEGGRHWATKLRNLDLLWFPRAQGLTPRVAYALRGAVRLALPEEEYLTNPHLVARGGLAARGSGCDPLEAPVFP